MTTAPPVAADRFSRARATRIASAAGLIGLTAGEVPTDEQLAHLAWHVAAIDPSELRYLDPVWSSSPAQKTCRIAHRQMPDDLDEVLPLPHPLDYEWRFDPFTRMFLAQRCGQLAGENGPIALLGTPTLAPALLGHSGDVLLVDANARLLVKLANTGQLGTIHWAAADLATFSPPRMWQNRAAVVVCDPPWYPEGFATFLCSAAQLVRPGGTVLVSVPDPLTRPSAADELDDLRGLARRLRLMTSAVEPRAVRYRTPFFEYRALRAAGVRLVPLNWRAGTLWHLTSIGSAPTTSVGQHRALVEDNAEVTIERVRVRVLHDCSSRPGILAFRPIVPGDTLPTVSRRHPARGSATLWTSGNTVLNCADPELAHLFLRHLTERNGYRLGNDHESLARHLTRRHELPINDVQHALDKINAVVAIERGDHVAYCEAAS